MSKHLESLHQDLLNGKLPHNLSWSEAVEKILIQRFEVLAHLTSIVLRHYKAEYAAARVEWREYRGLWYTLIGLFSNP